MHVVVDAGCRERGFCFLGLNDVWELFVQAGMPSFYVFFHNRMFI